MGAFHRLALLVSATWGTVAQAATAEIAPWLDLAGACEAMIAEQSQDRFDTFPTAPAQLTVKGLTERAIRHPEAPLIAYAASARSGWFMCIVKSVPPVGISEAGALVDAWTETQAARLEQPSNHEVAFEDKTTLQPVRVFCQDDAKPTVTFAFVGDDNDFRIGVVDSLPAAASNPCFQDRLE